MRVICFTIIAGLLAICHCEKIMANQEIKPLGPDEVHIAPNGISMPIGIILLVKKVNSIWAIKFINHEVRPGDGSYSRYECYQFNGIGFKIVQGGEVYFKEQKIWHKILNIFHKDSLRYASGLKCKEFDLFAHAGHHLERATVYFGPRPDEGDPSIYLAPTPWREVSEIIVSDKRIKWYQYDASRKRASIPIGKLWE
jgi:hypothetical protein